MSTTPGWLMVAMVRASPRNRSPKPGSSESAGSSTFTATVRPRTSSTARHTSPMPPLAMRSSRRYRPPRTVPGLIIETSLAVASLQRRLHDHARDPRRLVATARPGVLQQDRDRDLLATLDRKADEPAVVGRVAVLCRAGLATDLDAVDLRGAAGAVLDDVGHHALQLGRHIAVDGRAQDAGVGLVDRAGVSLQRVDDVRAHLLAAVGDRSRDHGALQGC